MDMANLAILDQRPRDEQPMIGGFLDERDDGRHSDRRGRDPCQTGIIQAHGHITGQVLELVAGQAKLGKDDEIRALIARPCHDLDVSSQILVEQPQSGGKLRQRDPE